MAKWPSSRRYLGQEEHPRALHQLYSKRLREKISRRKRNYRKNKWITHILPILTPKEIQEYVSLWEAVQQIQLDVDREDTITWRWTTDGEYTTKSAYCIQFEGTSSKLKFTLIWKAKAKPKCRFFAWTLLHKKILAANNLMKRHWPNDPICKLCGNNLETPTHLCKDCAFCKQVWSILKPWFGLSMIDTVGSNGSLHNYWHRCREKIDTAHKKDLMES
jgi:hypothetical protein